MTALCVPALAWSADIDIYGPSAVGSDNAGSNVLLFLDNTSNWSATSQAWAPGAVWSKCTTKYASTPEPEKTRKLDACKGAIEAVFYVTPAGDPVSNSVKRPWEGGFNPKDKAIQALEIEQGRVELRALIYVVNTLVCTAAEGSELAGLNLGVSMFDSLNQGAASTGVVGAFIYHAVKPLTKGDNCKALIDKLRVMDVKITDPDYKGPSSADYSAALFEAFKYFGGYTHPDNIGSAAAPVSRTGYGPDRFSNPVEKGAIKLDDPAAFVSGNITYKSPLAGGNICGGNYFVLVGNKYPNAEQNSSPQRFTGLGYTPPALSPVTSDTNRYADEWAYFLANTDIYGDVGKEVQPLYTYTVNVFNANPEADQRKLLRSMAQVGGIGLSAYAEVDGDLSELVDKLSQLFINIAAINSVFTATTLPVSTTVQGAYLNQIFVGMFRPDASFLPRWQGNLKQFKLDYTGKVLTLVGQDNKDVIDKESFAATARSFWTKDSVFFSASPSGTPVSASDLPDGKITEKGGAAQMLRENNLKDATGRNVYTIPTGTSGPASLSSSKFDESNAYVTGHTEFSGLTFPAFARWVRGENNVASGAGAELFVGSYLVGSTVTPLDSRGARHSIHGDVLHSRPLALSYGKTGGVDDVVVYYGTNDGIFHAVDGRQSGGGGELWSLVVPEHYPLLKRLYQGTPKVHLPETNSDGDTTTPASGYGPKGYGMDGPVGVYARYNENGSALTEAIIYTSMRRGGRAVYALDVTSKTNPTFLWRAAGGGGGDFDKLGQTWSLPKPIVYPSKTATPPVVVIMGGGYDPKEDKDGSDGLGKYVYIIHGRDGTLLKALETDYSVVADITLVDTNFDGIVDRAYAVDLRGNVYRIGFPAKADDEDKYQTKSYWDSATITKIADVGGSYTTASGVTRQKGKVFFPPDAVLGKEFVAVMVGTGDREKPLLNDTVEGMYLIKDPIGAWGGTVATPSNMKQIAYINNADMKVTASTDATADTLGCYLKLATNGEKVINAPFTIAGVTYFGTNRPKPVGASVCSGDLGEAYAYQFPLLCQLPDDPTLVPDGGLLPSPTGGVVLIDTDNDPSTPDERVPFLIGSGEGGSPFKPTNPQPAISPTRKRLYWRIDNQNR
jgi:type IV pilus assembly protein PilY1